MKNDDFIVDENEDEFEDEEEDVDPNELSDEAFNKIS